MGRLKRRRTLRVGIREQLALLVLLTSLVALAVVSVATWVNNFNFVVGIKSQGLALTASLKAAQVTSFIQLLQTTCNTIVTRVLIQQALQRFYTGNSTDANWVRATSDAQSALASGGYSSLLQIIIYPRNNTGNTYGLLNVTGSGIRPVALPYSYSNGSVSLKKLFFTRIAADTNRLFCWVIQDLVIRQCYTQTLHTSLQDNKTLTIIRLSLHVSSPFRIWS
jgi:hypothetical protein